MRLSRSFIRKASAACLVRSEINEILQLTERLAA